MSASKPQSEPAEQSHAHGDHHDHDCKQYLGSLSDYVDGDLGSEVCREIEAHMAECENCRVVVNTLSKTVSLYRQLEEPEMPNAVRERLFKVLDLGNLRSGTVDTNTDQS